MLRTPVLFLIFNRPDTTERVFEQIRKVKPSKLFIAADGYREDKEGEKEKCEQARAIVQKVDWECEVNTLFREKNLGCKVAVSSAINWFFDQVEEGIILEDDCLPNDSFFKYCATLLEQYRGQQEIMHIGGDNFQDGILRGDDAYYFSKYSHVWGWATWRRAWKLYDLNMQNLNHFCNNNLIEGISKNKGEQDFWLNLFHVVKDDKINTWDIQWFFSVLYNNGLAIIPNKNLVSNIGFGPSATHTTSDNVLSNLPVFDLGPIKHPLQIVRNVEADNYTFEKCFKAPRNSELSYISKGRNKIKSLIKKFL